MAEDRIRNQHISGVSTQNGSQAFVGSAQNVYFADHKSSQGTGKLLSHNFSMLIS